MQNKDLWDVQSLPETMTDLQCIVWNNQFIILGSEENHNCYSTPCVPKNTKLKWKQIPSLTFSEEPYGHAIVSMDNKAFLFNASIYDAFQTCNLMGDTPYKWHTETSNLELHFASGLRAIAINNLIFLTSDETFYVFDPRKMAQTNRALEK